MKTDSALVPSRRGDARNLSDALIPDWTPRVARLWEHSRVPRSTDAADSGEFTAACRVRDQLSNRLARVSPDGSGCGAQSMDTLRRQTRLQSA